MDCEEVDDAMTLSVLESILAEDGVGFEGAALEEDPLTLMEEMVQEGPVEVVVVKEEDEVEAKKRATKTKRADRKAALESKAQQRRQAAESAADSAASSSSATSSAAPKEESKAEGESETKEDKKQRRLIRNRMSAQLHRERKKAYVDHLEGLVRDRDAEIAALKARVSALQEENATLRTVSVDGSSSEKTAGSDNELSDSESSTHSRKRARKAGPAAMLLTAVSCVALFSSSPTTTTTPPVVNTELSRKGRALLSDAPFEQFEQTPFEQPPAYLPGVDEPRIWAYDRDVAAELFAFPPPASTVRLETVRLSNATSTPKLRGHKNTSLALSKTAGTNDDLPSSTSYVVCSSAAGVFGRKDDPPAGEMRRPRGALLSLPSSTSASAAAPTDDFIQLLVPSNEIDLRSWGHIPEEHNFDVPPSDLWLEIGAQLRYGRLVSNIDIHPSL